MTFIPTELFTVSIPGPPVAKGRPRGTAVQDASAKSGVSVRMFTPKRTRTWEALCEETARWKWRGRPPINHAVTATIVAVFPRTQACDKRKHDGRQWRPKRGDIDNVIKAALDGIQNAGIIEDDALVVAVHGYGVYAAKGEEPHVEITLSTVPDFPLFAPLTLAPSRGVR